MISKFIPSPVSICLVGIFVGLAISIIIVYAASTAYAVTINPQIDHSVGKSIFTERCSGCHSLEVDSVSRFGPNLARIGVDAATRVDGKNSAEYILESIVNPQVYKNPGISDSMPQGTAAGLSEQKLKRLIAYLYSLGRDYPYDLNDLSKLNIEGEVLERDKKVAESLSLSLRGEQLFFSQLGCAGCHQVSTVPDNSKLGPALSNTGALSREYILDSLRQPDKVVKNGYQQVKITMGNGVEYLGNLVKESRDTIELTIRNKQGIPALLEIDKLNIKNILIDSKSRMPAYELSKEDESALLAFLSVFHSH